jgi:hypothetical protein
MNNNPLMRSLIRDLGEGLILRRATSADAEALATFNARLHSDDGPDKPDERVAAWTRDLITRPHPTFSPGDFTIVEESAIGKIVSSLNLISQTWAYAGIEFGVGRPELVGTLPEYRKHGLVRLQFEEVHKWSAERGELLQAVTGIPYFYRQFGYEMALELEGGRTGFEMNLPKLGEGQSEPYQLRPANETDIPFLMEVDRFACLRSLVSCVRNDSLWRHELTGYSDDNCCRLEWRIIERVENQEPVGILAHPWYLWEVTIGVMYYELKPGISWLEVTPSVVRYLWQTGKAYAGRDNRICTAYHFNLGSSHPIYEVFRKRLPRIRDPYAWYLRLPDLPGFLRHISPVLEERIANSIAVNHSGEIKLNFYRNGLKLVLERGKLTGIESWQPSSSEWGQAAFPDLTFLQLVFGYRSFEELEQSFADCWWDNDEARVLLTVLFPKQATNLLPVV